LKLDFLELEKSGAFLAKENIPFAQQNLMAGSVTKRTEV
jgi:hypothetical protein